LTMRSHFLTIALLLLTFSSFAQYGTSFYHLGNATMQSTDYNPAYFPEGKFFLKLPGPGMNLYLNNAFSYSDLFTKQDNGDLAVNANDLINDFGKSFNITGDASFNLFHVGYQFGPRNQPDSTGLGISLFVNLRSNFNLALPGSLMDILWQGNGAFIGDKQTLAFGVNSTMYLERGLGLAYTLPQSNLKLGLRLKMLNGYSNFSTPSDTEATFLTKGPEDSYALEASYENMMIRSAGLVNIKDAEEGSTGYLDGFTETDDYTSLAIPANKGFAVDLGAEYKIDSNFTVALAINDLGVINWTENVSTYGLRDSSFQLPDFNLLEDDLLTVIEDTFNNNFDYYQLNEAYKTNLPTRIVASLIYTPWDDKTDIIATMNSRIIQGEFRSGFGIGINRKFGPKFILSTSVTKMPQQGLNMGAAISATAGFIQFYAGVDRMFGYSVYNLDWIQGQAGINLVFGSGPKRIKKVKPPKVKKDKTLPYKGTIYFYPMVDQDTTTANIYINDEFVADMFGVYSMGIVSDTTYALRVEKEGFITMTESIVIPDSVQGVWETRIYKTINLVPEEVLPTTIDLNLAIVSTSGEKVMGGRLELVNASSKETVYKGNVASNAYTTTAAENAQFTYKVKAREYFFKQGVINLSNAKDQPIVNEEIVLTKIEIDRKVNEGEILFETNSTTISLSSKGGLEAIIDLTTNNENVIVEIAAHTDDVGQENDNLRLSKARANVVRDYLISRGVLSQQLIAKGYGETQPIVPNSSEENRTLNRRVEIIIRVVN
jgi:outer membrane protein OmpA-like peptidoglycan-associated protein